MFLTVILTPIITAQCSKKPKGEITVVINGAHLRFDFIRIFFVLREEKEEAFIFSREKAE